MSWINITTSFSKELLVQVLNKYRYGKSFRLSSESTEELGVKVNNGKVLEEYFKRHPEEKTK